MGEKREKREIGFFASFKDLRGSDIWFSSEQEAKFIHHRKLCVGTKILEFQVGNFPTWIISSLKVI